MAFATTDNMKGEGQEFLMFTLYTVLMPILYYVLMPIMSQLYGGPFSHWKPNTVQHVSLTGQIWPDHPRSLAIKSI